MKIDNSAKIEKFLSREYNKIARDIIYEEDGMYHLFGQYQIKKTPSGEYLIGLKTTATEKTFYKLKNAVAWCVFDRQNLITQSHRIEMLDDALASAETALIMHETLYKRAKNNEARFIYLAKLNEDKVKKASLTRELQGFIYVSGNLLTERFEKTLAK